MADNLTFPFSGRVILDSNGDPVSGAKLEVFDAGTTDAHNVYTNAALTVAAANPIVANSSGVVPQRYLGTGDWKVTFKDSSDVTLANYDTIDNVPGAIDTSSFLTGTVAPSRATISKTANYTTVNATDNGKQINCDATGGDFTVTLDAATVGAGKDYVIKNTGETGNVTVNRGGDNPILAPLDSITVRSDGATWQIVEAYKATENLVVVSFASSITLDLIYPSGTNYQITATGDFTLANPTSVRPGTFFTVTVIQNATGGYEATFGSNFTNKPNVDVAANSVTVMGFHARTASVIDGWTLSGGEYSWDYVAYNEQTQNTAGGTATTGAWNDAVLNTVDPSFDRYSIGNPSSNQVTLPPGVWEIEWSMPFLLTDGSQTRLYDHTAAAELELGTTCSSPASDSVVVRSFGLARVTLSAASTLAIQYNVTTTRATDGQGTAGNRSTERYLRFKARKLASL